MFKLMIEAIFSHRTLTFGQAVPMSHSVFQALRSYMRKFTWGISGLILTTLSSIGCADDLPSSTQGTEACGMVNPSSRYQVEKGWNMFLTTEFLWWVSKEDGLYYVQSRFNGPAVPPGSKIFDGHLHKVKPEFRPGFRVGFGGNMGYDEWDILLNWTWFQSKAKDHAKGSLLTLWANPGIIAPPESTLAAEFARAQWTLHYNVVDFEIGRSFWVGRHFSLRPLLGIRGAWIDQHLKIRYNYMTDPVTEGKIHANSDFEGVGVRMGLDMRFALMGGWSFYSNGSASMLYGFYDCDFNERFESSRIARTSDGFHNAASSAQLGLGARWDTYFHKDRYHFAIYAGWEQNMWFGINKMNHFFNDLNSGNLEQMNGDLALTGGTFGARFDF